jgi:carbonic anhydrase
MFSPHRSIRLLKLNTNIASSLRQSPKAFVSRRFCSTETAEEKMASHKRTISAYLTQSHENIFENNRKWVAAKKESDPEFFDKLAAGQNPEYLYVCFPSQS